MVKLVMTEKGGEPRELEFAGDEVSIGRVQGNDIVLPKGNISKRHSKIVAQNGSFLVMDLKSTNGTYVNGRKIAEPTTVGATDKIYVGDFVITLLESGAGAAPRRAPTAPPPPPPRQSGPRSAVPPAPPRSTRPILPADDDEHEGLGAAPPVPPPTAPGRPSARPAPPPPPPRSAPAAARPDADDAGTDTEDEESLASSPPRRPAPPPLKPVPSMASHDEEDEPSPASRARAAHAPAAAAPRPRPAPLSSPSGASASLEALLGDEGLSAVFVSGPDAVHVERAGRVEGTSLDLGDATALADRLRRLAATGHPTPDPGALFIDVRLPDGARLVAAFPPLSGASATASFRKPARIDRSLDDLVGDGVLSREMRDFLGACAVGRRNILVTGDREALLPFVAAMAAGLPGDARTVTLGGLTLGASGWVGLAADERGLKAAAALRPDHLVVPEIGESWAGDLLAAAAQGTDGMVAGLPARSALEGIHRLEGLAGRSGGGGAIRDLIAATVDVVVHVASIAGGTTRVTEITDLKVGPDGRLQSEPLFKAEAAPDGRLSGRFVATGTHPRLAAGLAARGAPLPASLFRK